jgi:hypothetical protein
MSNMNSEEILAKYVGGMGKELGREFHFCRQQFIEVTVLWDVFETIFGRPERAKVLADAAGVLSVLIRQQLMQGVALGITKLLDPPGQGRFENLTLSRVCAGCTGQLQDKTTKLFGEIVKQAEKLRTIRNKLIAHNDYSHATKATESLSYGNREEITKLLCSILELFNLIDRHFLDQSTVILPLGNAPATNMLIYLHYGMMLRDLSREERQGRKTSLTESMKIPDFFSLTQQEDRRYGH